MDLHQQPQQLNLERSRQLREVLLAHGDAAREAPFWRWLEEQPQGEIDGKKRSNKFLLGCSLDYMIPASRAWDGAQRLAENILGDPENLWETITSLTVTEWNSRFASYALHRFPKAHERVWTIGTRVVLDYQGDASKIWALEPAAVVLDRLTKIGLGKQLSRMATGALIDIGQIDGTVDVKADVHVCRVLGRVVLGSPIQPSASKQATLIARSISPTDPWALDRPLYRIGKRICRPTDPRCGECPLQLQCKYRLLMNSGTGN